MSKTIEVLSITSSMNDTVHAVTPAIRDEIKKANLPLSYACGAEQCVNSWVRRCMRIALLISLCLVVSGCAGRYQIVNADFLTDDPKNLRKEPVLLDTWTGNTWTSIRVDGLYNWYRQHKCPDPACFKYDD